MTRQPRFVFYLAVLPSYRKECISILRKEFGSELALFVASHHLDPTVKTGLPREWFEKTMILTSPKNVLFLQLGHWRQAIAAETTIVDLNPRSGAAIALLVIRRALRRRTLTWGHLYPRRGAESRTAWLRRLLRKLSDGTVLYTHSDVRRAQIDLPHAPVWVAANALYPEAMIEPMRGEVRSEAIYVGRIEPAKKLDLLVRGFAISLETNSEISLRIVGDGSQRAEIERLVTHLGIAESVIFCGWVEDFATLRTFYAKSFCAVSPGFAGLGLTQSLGFGVPVLVSLGEDHSPEIELAETCSVNWFEGGSPDSLARGMNELWIDRHLVPDEHSSRWVQTKYSAEAMAKGLTDAIRDIE